MDFLPFLTLCLCPMRFAFFHRITRFALASTSGGIVSPICFAAFRLMTSSNFVGCSTGKIGGLGSLQDPVNKVGGAPVGFVPVGSVGH